MRIDTIPLNGALADIRPVSQEIYTHLSADAETKAAEKMEEISGP